MRERWLVIESEQLIPTMSLSPPLFTCSAPIVILMCIHSSSRPSYLLCPPLLLVLVLTVFFPLLFLILVFYQLLFLHPLFPQPFLLSLRLFLAILTQVLLPLCHLKPTPLPCQSSSISFLQLFLLLHSFPLATLSSVSLFPFPPPRLTHHFFDVIFIHASSFMYSYVNQSSFCSIMPPISFSSSIVVSSASVFLINLFSPHPLSFLPLVYMAIISLYCISNVPFILFCTALSLSLSLSLPLVFPATVFLFASLSSFGPHHICSLPS